MICIMAITATATKAIPLLAREAPEVGEGVASVVTPGVGATVASPVGASVGSTDGEAVSS